MNELEQEYAGRIDFIKVDIATTNGYCEFTKRNLAHTPSMLYRDSSGEIIETTDAFTEKDAIKQKLDDLLAKEAKTAACAGSEADLVPPPSGKPQLAYFYRDT